MRDKKREYRQTGLYRKIEEGQLDGRTQTAKLVKALTAELQHYVKVQTGEEPSVAVQVLIQRIVYKHVRLSNYENATVTSDKHTEAQHYIPFANSLRLDLAQLMTIVKGDKGLGLDEMLKQTSALIHGLSNEELALISKIINKGASRKE